MAETARVILGWHVTEKVGVNPPDSPTTDGAGVAFIDGAGPNQMFRRGVADPNQFFSQVVGRSFYA